MRIIIIFLSIYGVILLLSLIFHSYQKDFIKSLSKKEYHLLPLFPISLMLADAIRMLRPGHGTSRKEKLKALYIFEDVDAKNKAYQAQIIAYVLGTILVFTTFAFLSQLSTMGKTESTIQDMVDRPDYGEHSEKEAYQVVVEDQDFYLDEKLEYEVAPRSYTKESFHEAVQKAKTYLEKEVLGENTSAGQVNKALHLVKTIPDLGLQVRWIRDQEGIIKYDGSITYKEVTETKEIMLTAVVSSGELEEEIPLPLTVVPQGMSEQEKLLDSIKTAVEEADNSNSSQTKFQLPDTVNGRKVYFMKEQKKQYVTILMIGIFLAILIPLLGERKLKEQLEQREIQMRMDYPEVVNKLVLLLEAGMTVPRAWSKIAQDYEEEVKVNKSKKRYAYEELVASYYELKNGLGESQVYDNFGRRIKLTPYMKLSSLLAQNASKGMEGLLSFMKSESVEAFVERKELAKRLGEKAGTKMLLPMGLMLGVVLIVMIIPAFTMM